VLIYSEGELVGTYSMFTFDPVRLAPFKGRAVEIEIVGTIEVRSVAIATTVPELRE
jgi:hypothetical protein